jgi:activator of HSP90 ATPase
MKTKSFRQRVLFKNTRSEDLYDMILDSKKHAQFTGDKARISKRVGGKFTAYGDYIEGKNLDLKRPRKIVQSWRASDWEDGYFSKVTFEFKKSPRGTNLIFTHVGVPAEHVSSLKQGWIDYYWKPMKAALGLDE